MNTVTIATRGSALALWQAEHIKAALQALHPHCDVVLNIIKTKGDIIQDVPLAKVGGKGLFVKEIEEALLSGTADLAVHSMKDVPMVLPEGLVLGCVPAREVYSDSLLSCRYATLEALPQGAHVGTSSLRRQAQILALRPDLKISWLRGNVDTRLRKLNEGQYDAIILATAGLKRLGLSAPFQYELTPPHFVPAVGQGALGIECRADRQDILALLAPMEDYDTRVCVTAERAFLRELDGGCQVPIAGHAVMTAEGQCSLQGLVGEIDGTALYRESLSAPAAQAEATGAELARRLLQTGAKDVLAKLYANQAQ